VIVATVPVKAGGPATVVGVVVCGGGGRVVDEEVEGAVVVAARIVGAVVERDTPGSTVSVPDDPHAPVAISAATVNAHATR
jgi:hypothetical protein